MIAPPRYLITHTYSWIRLPKKEAEAPIKIKTKENPETYESVERITFFRIAFTPSVPLSVVNSSIERPVINVKYAGIKGKIQGEKKDKSPAIKAALYVIV